jgi:hypothetical protein
MTNGPWRKRKEDVSDVSVYTPFECCTAKRTSTVGREYHDSYSSAFLSSAGKFYLYSYTCRDSLD